MNQTTITAVMLALKPEPEPAEQIAQRAKLGRNQTYQALVHLYDRGMAFMSQESVTRRIEGWHA